MSPQPFLFITDWKKLKSKWFHKEQDQRNNQRIDRKGLDHGKTNDQRGRDLTGCAMFRSGRENASLKWGLRLGPVNDGVADARGA